MPIVGTEIYGRRDLQRILEALASAGRLHGPEYRLALVDVAIAVGVELSVGFEGWRVVEESTLKSWEGKNV